MHDALPWFGKPAQPIGRRAFLRATALALCAAGVRAAEPAAPVRVRFGLITDIHYADTDDRGTRHYRASLEKVRRAAAFMNREKPAFFIELGDFKDQGVPADPARTLEYLRTIETAFRSFEGPVHHAMGNHDVDSIAKEQFLAGIQNGGAVPTSPHYAFDAGGAHFVVLDANFSADGAPYRAGRFKWEDSNIPAAQLEWLRSDLAAAKGPAIVFVHQRLDAQGSVAVQNAAAVREVLEKSGRVRAVFQGHDHKGGFSRINGIEYRTLKSVIESAADAQPWAMAELDGDRLTVTGEAAVAPAN